MQLYGMEGRHMNVCDGQRHGGVAWRDMSLRLSIGWKAISSCSNWREWGGACLRGGVVCLTCAVSRDRVVASCIRCTCTVYRYQRATAPHLSLPFPVCSKTTLRDQSPAPSSSSSGSASLAPLAMCCCCWARAACTRGTRRLTASCASASAHCRSFRSRSSRARDRSISNHQKRSSAAISCAPALQCQHWAPLPPLDARNVLMARGWGAEQCMQNGAPVAHSLGAWSSSVSKRAVCAGLENPASCAVVVEMDIFWKHATLTTDTDSLRYMYPGGRGQ